MGLQAVLFDRGGTLVHERPGERVLYEILHPSHPSITSADLERAEATSKAFWREHHSGLPRGHRWNPDIRRACLKASLDALHLEGDTDDDLHRLDDYWDAIRIEGLYAGVHPCLSGLSAEKVPLGVLAQTLRTSNEVRAELERLGIARHFQLILSVEDLPWDKPDPRVFHEACQRLGSPPAEVLFVGDDPEMDGRGATSAGLSVVLVDRKGTLGGSEFPTIPNLAQLPGYVSTLK
jgi:putative hydrolase of the HAD superfamily